MENEVHKKRELCSLNDEGSVSSSLIYIIRRVDEDSIVIVEILSQNLTKEVWIFSSRFFEVVLFQ